MLVVNWIDVHFISLGSLLFLLCMSVSVADRIKENI